MSEVEGALLALFFSVLAVFFTVQVFLSFTSWQSLGIAVAVIGGVLLLWWLFGARDPSGLDLSRKTTAKLEEEERARKWWKL